MGSLGAGAAVRGSGAGAGGADGGASVGAGLAGASSGVGASFGRRLTVLMATRFRPNLSRACSSAVGVRVNACSIGVGGVNGCSIGRGRNAGPRAGPICL